MLTLATGVRDIVLPRRGDTRLVSWRYVFWLILLPLLGSACWYQIDVLTALSFTSPGIIAGSASVFGGLLFAHAIFVFQVRLSYDGAESERTAQGAQQDLRVRPLLDEMFTGALYAAVITVSLAMLTGFIAATLPPGGHVPPGIAAVVTGLALHACGAAVHVVNATTTAHKALKVRHPAGPH